MTFLERVMQTRAAEQYESASLSKGGGGDDKEPLEPRPFWKECVGADGLCRAWHCTRKARARGLCDSHYYQARRQGLIEFVHKPHPRKGEAP